MSDQAGQPCVDICGLKRKDGKLHRDTKWLLGGVFTLVLSVVTVGGGGIWKLGAMDGRLGSIEKSQITLNATLRHLIENQIADMQRRLVTLEGKDILPRAERELERLAERVRDLELQLSKVKAP